MSTAEGISYRPAAPGDVKLLTRMLWVAFNWRNEAVSEQHQDPAAAMATGSHAVELDFRRQARL
jgi:hypothetical protein